MTRMLLRHWVGATHHGREHIPRRGAAILVCNHPTMGDPFTVAFGTKRWVSWLAWDEAFAWPGAGYLMQLYRSIPLNLERPKPSSIKAAYGTLARGRILGVFIEGERSEGYLLNPTLKPGAARMALRMRVPLVPVSISGARRSWPLEQPLPSRGRVVVRYHPPIDPTRFRPDLPHHARGAALTAELARIIAAPLPADGRPY
ncbi:MAG TPA: hypothetical protein DEA08_18180 [Planctomycetes bacterium]|nr:hypothetical protein [Planctomycetota bacterium]